MLTTVMIKTERACQEVVKLRYDIRPNCASYNRGLWEKGFVRLHPEQFLPE